MAMTASSQPEALDLEAAAMARVEAAEAVLYRWACGTLDAKGVHRELATLGVRLLDKLRSTGLPMVDAEVEGYPHPVALTF